MLFRETAPLASSVNLYTPQRSSRVMYKASERGRGYKQNNYTIRCPYGVE